MELLDPPNSLLKTAVNSAASADSAETGGTRDEEAASERREGIRPRSPRDLEITVPAIQAPVPTAPDKRDVPPETT